jgi:hypothetical protein
MVEICGDPIMLFNWIAEHPAMADNALSQNMPDIVKCSEGR